MKLKIIFIFSALASSTIFASDFYRFPQKKLLQFGWDTPTPSYIENNIQYMETNTPYDGIGIRFDRQIKINGKKYNISSFSAANPSIKLQYEYFIKDIEILKNVNFKQFTDNFLETCLTSSVDWFDDEKWDTIAHNFGVLAKCAREAGLKGLRIDSESYDKNAPMFKYDPKSGKSFKETFKMARKRGGQIMKAIAKEYPECVIFSFIWISAVNSLTEHKALKNDWYGLKIPFINGFYDEITPYTVIHEGVEDKGYAATSRDDYRGLYMMTKRMFEYFALQETRNRIISQTRIAPALYLDAYLTHKQTSPYYIGKKGTNQIALLENNLAGAFEFSDEYVWTWGERGKWWPIRYAIPIFEGRQVKKGDGLWAKAFPGLLEAMRRAKDPYNFYSRYAAEKKLPNLIKNADFAIVGAKKFNDIPRWKAWHSPLISQNGVFSIENDAKKKFIVKAQNCGDSCLKFEVPVKPGEKFLVEASLKTQGESGAKIMVYWRNANHEWIKRDSNASFSIKNMKNGVFHRIGGVVETPPGETKYLVILLCANGQNTINDITYFYAPAIFKLN